MSSKPSTHLHQHPDPEILHKRSLSITLEQILREEHEGQGITVAQMLARMGDKALGLLLVLIAFAGSIPMPATGYSTPFGFILLLLSFQLLFGRTTPWLPERALKLRLHSKILEKILSYAARFSKKIEPWIHPRLPWVCGRLGRFCMAVLMLIMSVILILPIPFMNTAPCLVMFLMAVGLSEDDGLFMLMAMAVATVASALFIYIAWIFYTLGFEGLISLKDHFFALFSSSNAASS